MMQGNVLGK